MVSITFMVVFCMAVTVAATLLAQVLSSLDNEQLQVNAVKNSNGAAFAGTVSDSRQQVPRAAALQEKMIQRGEEKETKEILKLTLTDVGLVKITLRPDFSKESVDYIHQIAKEGCTRCTFYRAEKPGILQGMMKNKDVPIPSVKGSCPAGYENVKNECPKWDQHCSCHGPIMERGHVAWAAGATGPDFFIDNYKQKATWWGTQHTNWGKIEDQESFNVLDKVWTLPAKKSGGLTYLDKPIRFEMEIITETLSGAVSQS